MDLRHRGRLLPAHGGDLDDVEQQERAQQLGQLQREFARDAEFDELVSIGVERVALVPAQ